MSDGDEAMTSGQLLDEVRRLDTASEALARQIERVDRVRSGLETSLSEIAKRRGDALLELARLEGADEIEIQCDEDNGLGPVTTDVPNLN